MFPNFFKKMSKKILFKFLVFITICLINITNSYAYVLGFLGTWETIKELKQSIQTLDKVNNQLKNDFNELNADIKLKSFLRNDLSLIEFQKIKTIVWNYNKNNKIIEEKLLLNAKKQISIVIQRKKLLEQKRLFYNWLIPFINIDFKNEHLEYIRRDAEIFNKQNIVLTDIEVKKEILDTKVTRIESKIIKHKEFIRDSIRKVIEERLDLKIRNLVNNETFIVLKNDSKIKVLEKTIRKIKIKLQNLEKSRVITWTWITTNDLNLNSLENKIDTFNIAIKKLEKFKNSLSK